MLAARAMLDGVGDIQSPRTLLPLGELSLDEERTRAENLEAGSGGVEKTEIREI